MALLLCPLGRWGMYSDVPVFISPSLSTSENPELTPAFQFQLILNGSFILVFGGVFFTHFSYLLDSSSNWVSLASLSSTY